MRRNKRGSHVGVMISFMVFITFIFFLRVILEPTLTSNQDKEVMLNEVEKKIINETSVEMTTITIDINSATTQNCVSIASFISEFGIDSNIVVKNKNGNIISSSVSPTESNTLQINRGSTTDNFFKVYNSEAFSAVSSASLSCQSISENTNFEYGITKKDDYVSEEKIIFLIESYADYEAMKSDLKIPNSTDIAISFEYADGSSIGTNKTEPTTNIFAREKQINYINENAEINSGKLKIKVW